MQFGSVAFFKMLIKIVLCVLFFVPLVLCVVFAVMLWNRNAELDRVAQDNERLGYTVAILSGEKEPTVEGFYGLYQHSGLSDEDLLRYILLEKNSDTDKKAPQNAPDSSVSSGGSSSDSGISSASSSAEETTASPAAPDESGAPAETSEVSRPDASQPEVSQPEASQTEASQPAEPTVPAGPYAGIHADMTVELPGEFVRDINTIYLTFDDGPSRNTYTILNYLEKYGVKATFFVVPQRTEDCYAKLRAIASAGHTIGVHSASHVYREIYASTEAFLEDFYEAWDIIHDATGKYPEIFRFPGGSVNDFNGDTRADIIAEMTRRGFRYYDWNVDSGDAAGADWTQMYTSVPVDIKNNYRAFVLMHDSSAHDNTILVLGDLLDVLTDPDFGYKFDCIHSDTKPVQFVPQFE